MASQQKSEQDTSDIPKDASTIIAVLKDMGITDYEPKVINQLLEFTYSKFFKFRVDISIIINAVYSFGFRKKFKLLTKFLECACS